MTANGSGFADVPALAFSLNVLTNLDDVHLFSTDSSVAI